MTRDDNDSVEKRLAETDRLIRRDRLRQEIQDLGGLVGGANDEEVSEHELAFLERVVAWETGPRSTHRAWLARHGQNFVPPAELAGPRRGIELGRLIHALAGARVFLCRTDHLSDAELYTRLWSEVLPEECPDAARGPDDAWVWDFADAGSGAEDIWLRFYASPRERKDWRREFPSAPMPERQRPPYHRDHGLPGAG